MTLLIENINWNKLKQEILRQESLVDKKGYVYKEISLGKVSWITPSGKTRFFGRPSRDLISRGSYVGYMKSTINELQHDQDIQRDSD